MSKKKALKKPKAEMLKEVYARIIKRDSAFKWIIHDKTKKDK